LLFHSFDEDYLRRLASGDAVVEQHFSSYFGDLLSLKLRVRIRSPQLVEDIRQETLLRVLQIVRRKGVEHPERFGAFVSAVCNNVLMEQVRGEMRHEGREAEFEVVDERVDLDAPTSCPRKTVNFCACSFSKSATSVSCASALKSARII